MFAGLALLGIGAIQLVSLIVRYITLKDPYTPYGQAIKKYFKIVTAYFVILAAGVKLSDVTHIHQSFWVVWLFFLPLIMAIYYWNIIQNKSREYPDFV